MSFACHWDKAEASHHPAAEHFVWLLSSLFCSRLGIGFDSTDTILTLEANEGGTP